MFAQSTPVRVFVSYAHEDREWCDQILRHLGWLRNAGQVETFDDRQLEAGEEWEARLRRELERADVIVLIVTANFLDSRFCTTVELRRALERYRNDATRIVPIIADHCDWQALPIGHLQVLPQDPHQNLKPLRDWQGEVNKPLAAIAQSIRQLVDRIERGRLSETMTSAPATPAGEPPVVGSSGDKWVHPHPPDRLIGRTADLRRIVDTLTADPPGHVVVFGTGGIGKTTLTLQAASDPDVVRRFGEGRCFVSLEAANSPEGLVAALHASLGLSPEADPWNGIESVFRQRGQQPTLVVLDNLETPWECEPRRTEELLARIARLPHAVLLASIRGGEVPLRPAWRYQLELHRLQSPDDRELFCAIAPVITADDNLLTEVLRGLDGVPLAIELFAAQAQAAATLVLPWQRWARERTAMLARGANRDRLSSLDVSLRLSVMSPRMHDSARRLFAMLGRLPRGLAVGDADILLPGTGADAAMRLVQTRLARERDSRLVMLAPVRDYARDQELSAEDQARLGNHFARLGASLGGSLFSREQRDAVLRARAEIDNIDAVIELMLRDPRTAPDTERWLAVLLADVADARVQLGGLPLAAVAYERTLAIFQRRAAADPANAGWQSDLSISWIKVGDLRHAQGDLTGALSAYEDGRAIAEQLAAADAANAGWQRDLSVSWNKVGDVRRAQGDLAGALRAFEDTRVIAERLAAADPANAEWQRDLSVSWNKVGDVRQAQGDLAGALRAFEDARVIRERLAAADPANAEWQRDLSISWNNIGDMRRAQGDLAGALRAYDDGRLIAERLAAGDPANAEWQRDLSFSLNRIAECHYQEGNRAEALRCAENSLSIGERLAALDPTNVMWQEDVVVSRAQVARLRG